MKNIRHLQRLLVVSALFSVGCSPTEKPDTSSKEVSQSKETIVKEEDKKSDAFSLEFYSDTEIKNCADGLLVINKTNQFSKEIKTLKISWGDGKEKLPDYNEIALLEKLEASEIDYTFTNHSLIPDKATKIWVEALNESNDVLEKATIGVEDYKEKNELLYKFEVISDQQISRGTSCFYRRSKKTFADIKEEASDSIGIFVNGDIVDEAKAENYDDFYESYNEVFQNKEIPMTVGIGNHEFIIQSEDGNYTGYSENQLNQMYQERLALWKEKTKNENPYFSLEKEGSKFIFLGTTKMPKTLDGNARADCTLGEEELSWFKKEIEDGKKTNKPIFIFSHGSLRNTVSGSLTSENQTWYGYSLEEENKIREIIKDDSKILFFSSHSHWSFENKDPYRIEENGPSFFNTAAIGYLWEGKGGGHIYKNGSYEKGGAQGLYLEVYKNQILIKGRQFEAADGKSKYYYSGYQVVLPIE